MNAHDMVRDIHKSISSVEILLQQSRGIPAETSATEMYSLRQA